MLRALRCTSKYIQHFGIAPASKLHHLRFYASDVSLLPASSGNLDLGPAAAIRLRGYQEECIQSVLSYLVKGHRRLGISLATGSGKTVIFTRLIDRVPAPTHHATRTLILVHRRELVEQAARHCAEAYPTKSIEIEMGNVHASGTADITIASVRSITSGDRMSKFDPETFKLILVDEAHHIVASGYMETLRYFGVLGHGNPTNVPVLVGVSATLSRFDGLRLSDAIDHIVYHKDYVDMIGEKWLSDVMFTTVQSRADISQVKTGSSGDFQIGGLSKAVNTKATNDITVRAWLARASTRQSTLVFCVDLAHVTSLTATFQEHGIDARLVTGDTPKRVRSQRLDAFKSREYPVLLNCGVFTEGTDIPNIDCVLLARPTRSRNLLVQMIGRGLRLSPGKTNCHVIDMVASLKAGIVTTPTLFGLDPTELVHETDLEGLHALQERRGLEKRRDEQSKASPENTPSPCAPGNRVITFTDYDSVHDLIDDTSGERHIRSISMLCWVLVGPNRYVLSTHNGDHLSLETVMDLETDPQFRVTCTQKLLSSISASKSPRSPFMRPREIALSRTFSDAVHAADTFVAERYGWSWRMLTYTHPWRKQPASEGQLDILNKIRRKDNQLTSDDVTKGKAADMITKLKFGAKGHFNQLKAAKKRAVREMEQMDRMGSVRQREQVMVGPTKQMEKVLRTRLDT